MSRSLSYSHDQSSEKVPASKVATAGCTSARHLLLCLRDLQPAFKERVLEQFFHSTFQIVDALPTKQRKSSIPRSKCVQQTRDTGSPKPYLLHNTRDLLLVEIKELQQALDANEALDHLRNVEDTAVLRQLSRR